DAFLKLSGDKTLSVQKKLALAFSGWVLGSGNANTNLDLAIRQWEARFLAAEYLRTPAESNRAAILEKIRRLEGVKPEHLGQMVPYLPPILETPGIKPGHAHMVTVAGREGKPAIKYAVLLPPEYNPQRQYPAIVALRPQERSLQTELLWWGGSAKKQGQAQRQGYIVIAPEYVQGKTGGYDYSSQAHVAVIESLRDARKRFSIDSDRVFLSGHGSGGDAAFDMGMSHPDLFAGVIPIVGVSDKYCNWYYLNARHMPWYIVSGELARNSLQRNARQLTQIMTKMEIEPHDN
ncbi:peptidase, partial [bacterium]|nr:peptidase [bacterium]